MTDIELMDVKYSHIKEEKKNITTNRNKYFFITGLIHLSVSIFLYYLIANSHHTQKTFCNFTNTDIEKIVYQNGDSFYELTLAYNFTVKNSTYQGKEVTHSEEERLNNILEYYVTNKCIVYYNYDDPNKNSLNKDILVDYKKEYKNIIYTLPFTCFILFIIIFFLYT